MNSAWPGALGIATRALTALVGGYVAAAAASTLLARLLPGSAVEASAWGMILSFLILAGLGLWAFHEPRLARVAAVIWGTAALCAAAAMLLGARP